MATQRSPHTPSSIPTRSSKRPSFSVPAPNTPASTTLRSLRSLLPFGPNKQPTPISASVSPNPNASRSPFASFSSVRKSISVSRERKSSFSGPVLSIERSPNSSDDFPIRKSLSCTTLDRTSPDNTVHGTKLSFQVPTPFQEDLNAVLDIKQQPISRTPSPNALELSTIIEADTSGISKHLPSASRSPSPSPTDATSPNIPPSDNDTSLDLSTTHVHSQVLDALIVQEYTVTSKWLDNEIHAAHGDPESSKQGEGDISFNLDALDPDLAALLSPHRMAPSESNKTISGPQPRHSTDSTRPSGSPISSTGPYPAPPSPRRIASLSRPQHQSSRPRLRPVSIRDPSGPSDEPEDPARLSPSSLSHLPRRPPPSPLSSSHPPSATSSASSSIRRPAGSRLASPSSASPPSSRQKTNSTQRPPLNHAWESAPTPSSSSRPGTAPQPSTDSAYPARGSLDNIYLRNNVNRALAASPSLSTASGRLPRSRKRSMSVQENRFLSGNSPRPGSSLSAGPQQRTEWLGPRTAKAFRAAGLLDHNHHEYHRDGSVAGDNTETETENGSGSVNGSRGSARGPGFGFGSVRSGSSGSRMMMASPVGGRRGSGSYYGGGTASPLMESPTFTVSSRDTHNTTPRSVSTAPTSVSGASGSWRDSDREAEEIRELKEKHASETEALLGALSDSQRTTRMLREENAELRNRMSKLEGDLERAGKAARENEVLREFAMELREQVGELNLKLRMATVAQTISASPRHLAPPQRHQFHFTREEGGRGEDEEEEEDREEGSSLNLPVAFSSTPAKTPRRRPSTSSSIFPVPPPNMTMLLNEESAYASQDRSLASSHSPNSPTVIIPRLTERGHILAHAKNTSIGTMSSVSPNTSMMGSPRSLSLMPEHEVHLGDMEGLDLSVVDGREEADLAGDGWSE